MSSLSANAKVYPVLKSNAYGHGLSEVFDVIQDQSQGLCCYYLDEAFFLRELGYKKPIVLLGPTHSSNDFKLSHQLDLSLFISDMDSLTTWSESSHKPNVFIKLDTGMGRFGFQQKDFDQKLLNILIKNKQFIHGISTHIAYQGEKNEFYTKQVNIFNDIKTTLKRAGIKTISSSISSSESTLFTGESGSDINRLGIATYGLFSSKKMKDKFESQNKKALQPVLSLSSPIQSIKHLEAGTNIGYGNTHKLEQNTMVGVVAMGYAEGYPWSCGPNKNAQVEVLSKRCNILGRICMNNFMIDLSPVSNQVSKDDKAFLIGGQGENPISVYELEKWSGSFSYEITTRLHPDIPRFVV